MIGVISISELSYLKKRKWKPPKKEMSKKPKKSKIQPNLEDLAMELLKN